MLCALLVPGVKLGKNGWSPWTLRAGGGWRQHTFKTEEARRSAEKRTFETEAGFEGTADAWTVRTGARQRKYGTEFGIKENGEKEDRGPRRRRTSMVWKASISKEITSGISRYLGLVIFELA